MSEYLPATSESKFSNFAYLINNNFYDFRVFLGSYDGRLKLLSPSSIKSLVIEDALDNPFHCGHAILDNRQDNIESNFEPSLDASSPEYYILGFPSDQSPSQPRNKSFSEGFLFNGDSRDILRVQILPKLTLSNDNTNDQDALKHFLLTFDFVIYNTEEITDSESQDSKLKKIYFWELDYEILREKNSYFSTSNYLKSRKTDIQDLTDDERKITTGAALSAALKEGLSESDGLSINFGTFDTGASTIFYSSPANFKCIDTINYILERHVSTPNNYYSPCILQLERYPKTYTLRSLYEIFKNAVNNNFSSMLAGPDYLETYKIAGYSDDKPGRLPVFNVEFAPSYSPYFQTEGNLDTYSFDTAAGVYTQTVFNSKAVHYYDYSNKQFEINSFRNSINETSSILNKGFVEPFAGRGTQTFQLGNYRKQNKNIENTFASVETDVNTRLSLGLAKNLKNYVFLNNFVTFRVQGATHRQAGKFIGITRETNKQPSSFDNKFLGIYFITHVKHIFENAKYYNELICVKTYNPKDMFINKNVL